MVYAAHAEVVWLYGGRAPDPLQWLADAWTWDGQWEPLFVPDELGVLEDPSAAYDLERQCVVLYGVTPFPLAHRLWEWCQDGWHDRSDVAGPPPLVSHRLVYDPVRKETLLYGNTPSGGVARTDEAWAWNGNAWRQAEVGPGFIRGPWDYGVTFDFVREGAVYFFGGASYLWNADGWGRVGKVVDLPPLGVVRGATYVAPSRSVFSAWSVTDSLTGTDTAERLGREWRGRPSHPDVRGLGSALAYEPNLDALVLYEGSYRLPVGPNEPPRTVTSTRTFFRPPGSGFVEIVTSDENPGPRQAPALVFHPDLERLVLFGGSWMNDDVWTFDSEDRWQALLTTSIAPVRRTRHRMVFDERARALVLYGGSTFGIDETLSDMWRLEGGIDAEAPPRWQQVPVPLGDHPGPRSGHGLVYDPVRQKTILHGGFDGTGVRGDVWEWDGTSWRRQEIRQENLVEHADHAFVWDPLCRCAVLFGESEGAGPRRNTWEYHHPPSLRPAVELRVGVSQGPLRLDEIEVRATGGGRGYSSTSDERDVEIPGAQVVAWNVPFGRWDRVGASGAGLGAGETFASVLAAPAATYVDRNRELYLRFEPIAGDGRGALPSEVRVDRFEVHLHYRR